MQRLLLKTTIPTVINDWHVGRFSMLADLLSEVQDSSGEPSFEVVAADRVEDGRGDDADLALLADFDQLWLFAVDVTGALTSQDVARIDAFRDRGGACLLTRDHCDMGSCLVRLKDIGLAHHFHRVNPEREPERQTRDDRETIQIDWPNYHSGRNGDWQRIDAAMPVHPILQREGGSPIEFVPAHPHEGAVSVPPSAEERARVLATGRSLTTGRRFNIAVAFEGARYGGRAVAEATFHRFADYNWDPASGAPDFVTEPVGDGLATHPQARADTRGYAINLARWLAGHI